MMEPKEEDSSMLGAEEKNQATAGVGEEDGENVWETRYSKVRFSKNMTSEELLDSLKRLTGPGAEDEKKRRRAGDKLPKAKLVKKEKKEKKIEKFEEIQIRSQLKMARDAQRTERREMADAKFRWKAEHPEEAAKMTEKNKGARKRAAQKAEKRLLVEFQSAREIWLPSAADRNMAKSDAARGVGEEAVEADAMNDAEEMDDDDADVNMMKNLEYAESSAFSLVIRGK